MTTIYTIISIAEEMPVQSDTTVSDAGRALAAVLKRSVEQAVRDGGEGGVAARCARERRRVQTLHRRSFHRGFAGVRGRVSRLGDWLHKQPDRVEPLARAGAAAHFMPSETPRPTFSGRLPDRSAPLSYSSVIHVLARARDVHVRGRLLGCQVADLSGELVDLALEVLSAGIIFGT